jgi:glycosyltransferase involved in cell wall biosynthesis
MAKTHKILLLVENCSVPADGRVWPEALALHAHGYQVSIISPKGEINQRESYLCLDGIHIYRYTIPLFKQKYISHILEYSIALIMTFLLSVKVLLRHGFDVIHTANPPDIFFLVGLFYRLLGKKFVFDQHDLSPELFQVIFQRRAQWMYRLMRLFEKGSYKAADLVIVTNESQKKLALERGRCHPDQVFVVRNGPKMELWQAAQAPVQRQTNSPFLLGYVGLMGPQDGVEYTLYALAELVHTRGRRDVSLLLLGAGSSYAGLQSLTRKLQLDEYVTFTGMVPLTEVVQQLATIDIGLIPDPQNGVNEFSTMIKTMEYMAAGKPIVAFDLAETRFTASEAALYASSNLAEELADKIEILLTDSELRTRMGEFGRCRVANELSWEQNSKKLLSAYETLFH